MDNEIKVFKQRNLTFILTPTQTIVRTSLPQTFFLEPKAHYWRRRVNLVRIMMEVDQIHDMNDLASWCGSGVNWVSTRNKYDVDGKVVLR